MEETMIWMGEYGYQCTRKVCMRKHHCWHECVSNW